MVVKHMRKSLEICSHYEIKIKALKKFLIINQLINSYMIEKWDIKYYKYT